MWETKEKKSRKMPRFEVWVIGKIRVPLTDPVEETQV